MICAYFGVRPDIQNEVFLKETCFVLVFGIIEITKISIDYGPRILFHQQVLCFKSKSQL